LRKFKSMKPLELSEKSRVLVLTGAGISAESGVPTFRGMGGLWEGHPVERVASPEGFAADPALVWRFYRERRRAAKAVQPNPGHTALVELERRLGDRFLLATQNVDGLHARAGSVRQVALHGELMKSRCVRCAEPFDDGDDEVMAPLPRCARCGAAVRPHIVWFGEMLDPAHLERVSAFIEHAGEALVFLAVGTSGNVYPAAGFVDVARAQGGETWLVDLEPSPDFAARFDEVLRGKSGALLPALLA
jgi:NAD-dependent deacetylase